MRGAYVVFGFNRETAGNFRGAQRVCAEMRNGMQHLFLQQSYQDCWEAYTRSMTSEHAAKWDYVILTASNEEQAASYRMQLDYRRKEEDIPAATSYVVLSDPEGKRVGSGGATLNVLRYLAEQLGGAEGFAGKRILVIHSGGDSKRVPQYSACGKIFSPVPRELPDGRCSTLFDEFLISMAGVAGRLKEGMLVLSGDVLLLFNPLQIDFSFSGAAALSIKGSAEVGREHGVFLNDGNDFVGQFLHKQPEEVLRSRGAVNHAGCVDLDTGAVALDVSLMKALFGLISTAGRTDAEKFARFVNDRARISFYGDFLYPLAKSATKEAYFQEAAEGELCEELLACREEIWNAISGFDMRLLSLTPAEFIHFGTTAELLSLVAEQVEDYRFLGWRKQVGTNVGDEKYAVHNALVREGCSVGENAYLENSLLGRNVRIGKGSIVSGLDLERMHLSIPAGMVMHGLKLKDGRYVVRVFGVKDNPKDCCSAVMSGTILRTVDPAMPLWEAPVYPICATMAEAAEAALVTCRMMQGCASVEEKQHWLETEKCSMRQSFQLADTEAALLWNRSLADRVAVEKAVDLLNRERPWQEAAAVFGKKGLTRELADMLQHRAEEASFFTAIRIYHMLMNEAKRSGSPYEKYEELCFGRIRTEVYESGRSSVHYREYLKLCRSEAHVELPVRVNWGGGWTDTPPYCMEKGGTVVNAAIRLKGILPVQVTVRRLKELKIEVASEDVGAYGELHTLEEVLDCHNPYDAFALHKAALIACGVVPFEADGQIALEDILARLGGGLFLSTQVIGIPKGSGLGTSSILAGACAKALFEIMGEKVTEEQLYEIVLCMEQIMSTGGGWQDQVGGLVPGVKYITTAPGLNQRICVQRVSVPEAAARELQERFALIYTGQRRLARNLLRDVVGSYVGRKEEAVDALFRMQRVAALMRFELEKGNIQELAALFNHHWELSKQLDAGSSNTCIEQIFRACGDLIDGRFIAGAGGGGFLQVILKKKVTREQLHDRLKEVFQDSGVDVWDSEFIWE